MSGSSAGEMPSSGEENPGVGAGVMLGVGDGGTGVKVGGSVELGVRLGAGVGVNATGVVGCCGFAQAANNTQNAPKTIKAVLALIHLEGQVLFVDCTQLIIIQAGI